MSLPRPSSLKTPAKVARPSGLVQPKSTLSTSTSKLNDGHAVGNAKAPSQTPDLDCSGTNASPAPAVQSQSLECADFKFGDRVWVAGSKPGVIAFIGETQFAPGEWAGVILDTPIGKNDGSVAGVRYFSCKPLFGIFSKLSNLTHCPGLADQSIKVASPAHVRQRDSLASNDSGVITSKTSSADELPSVKHSNQAPNKISDADLLDSEVKPPPLAASSRSLGLVRPTSYGVNQSAGSIAGNRAATKSASGSSASINTAGALQIGCRVLVSGNKIGTLRFVGVTHFAKGEWAGIELDGPQGKNDGSVEGKRYFTCNPLYGLFAPVGKVVPQPAANVASAVSSLLRRPSAHSMTHSAAAEPLHVVTPTANERSGSQESLNSVSSVTSSASRSRVRLGISSTAAGSGKVNQLKNTAPLATSPANTSALQKALKEKEEHVQQLLVERDLERSEMARVASHLDEVEAQLSAARVRYDMHVAESEDRLQLMIQTLEKLELENSDLRSRLDEEKKKVDDLQFAIEEVTIDEGDSRVRAETDKRRLTELEKQLVVETERSFHLQQLLNNLTTETSSKSLPSDNEDVISKLKADIELLSQKIATSEEHMSTMVAERDKYCAEVERLSHELHDKSSEVSSLTASVLSQSSTVTELNIQQEALQMNLDEKSAKLLEYQSNIDELKQQLESSINKGNHLQENKSSLEQQLSDLVSRSGDSSEQLVHMNSELRNRDSTITQLQSGAQEMQLNMNKVTAQLDDELQKATNRDTEIARLSALCDSHIALLSKKEDELQAATSQFTATIATLEDEKLSLQANVQLLSVTQAELNQEKNVHKLAMEKELAEVKAALSEAIEKTNNKSGEIESLLKTVESLNSSLSEAQSQVEAEKTQASTDKHHWEFLNKLLESKVAELQERLNSLQVNQKQASAPVTSSLAVITPEELQSLKDENAALTQSNVEVSRRLSETLTQLKAECEAQERLRGEKLQLADELSRVTASNSALQLNQSTMSDSIADLRLTNQRLQAENDSLLQSLAISSDNVALVEKLSAEISELKEHMAAADLRYEKASSNLQAERASLIQSVGDLSTELNDKELVLKKLNKEIDSLKAEVETLKQQSTASVDMNADQTNNNNTEDLSSRKQYEKRENDEVRFLNAVIVDLQSKNVALQLKIDCLLSADNEADALNSSGSSDVLKTVAPRLFCDICDVFDQHDTDDCPVQASSNSPPPRPVHHEKVLTNNDRPYCDICEVFGHWSDDCDDQQTF